MAWKDVDLEQWAHQMGVDIHEIDQKVKLREMIVNLRKKRGLTQEQLAKLVGLSRSRIAQIESGVKLHKMTFDILLHVLQGLGVEYNITARKQAA